MKIIDRNGRLFGKISVIDLIVVAVVVVMAAALHFKSGQTHTGTSVTEQPITFQVQARGLRSYAADALRVGDSLYDQGYSSGGRPLGRITDIQVEQEPGTGTATLFDGTVATVPSEGTVDLILTIEGSGLVSGRSVSINRVYDLGINSSRNYCTKYVQFIGTVSSIG